MRERLQGWEVASGARAYFVTERQYPLGRPWRARRGKSLFAELPDTRDSCLRLSLVWSAYSPTPEALLRCNKSQPWATNGHPLIWHAWTATVRDRTVPSRNQGRL